MMRNRTINTEMGLFLLIFLMALALRLMDLARNPLTDAEASLALQALELARGGSPALSGQPGYIVLTAFLFFLTRAVEFTARFLPAVAGSLLIWAVYLFRPVVGRLPALFLAFFLAIEPGLVAASRQADGLIFAASFGLLAAAFLYRRQPIAAGIFAGLALLGGPGIWMGILIAAVAVLTASLFGWKRLESQDIEGEVIVSTWPWRVALPWMAGTVLILGTFFLWIPTGISALFTSLTAFISGWGQSAVFPAGRALLLLPAYAPLAIFLGGAGLVGAFIGRSRFDRFFVFWFFSALILVLIYPGRQAPDMIWALLPLWVLAARQAARYIQLIRSDLMAFAGQLALVFVLLIFTWLTFVLLSNQQVSSDTGQFRWLTIIGSLLLMLVVAILIAWGWSAQSAAGGLVWGVTAVLLIYTVSSAFNAAGLGRRPEAELWQRTPYVDQADLLLQTTANMSQWNTPAQDALDLVVVDVPAPSLEWALRDYRSAQISNVLLQGTNPSMVITREQEEPSLAAGYTGQGFVWQRYPIWDGVNWMRWAIVRAVPVQPMNIILWVRTDLHPGGGQDLTVEPLPNGE
jgi:hypothetical protein